MEKMLKIFAGTAIALAFASLFTLALLSWGFVPLSEKAPQAAGRLAMPSSPKVYAKRERVSQTSAENPSNQVGKLASTGLATFHETLQSAWSGETKPVQQSPKKPQQHLSVFSTPVVYAASQQSAPRLVAGSISAPISTRTMPATPPTPAAKELLQLPAAMVDVTPETSITTETQVAEWERLQDEFVAKVDDKLPTDTTSQRVWVRAQQQNDELFRTKFGTEAFLRQQMDAYRQGFLQM